MHKGIFLLNAILFCTYCTATAKVTDPIGAGQIQESGGNAGAPPSGGGAGGGFILPDAGFFPASDSRLIPLPPRVPQFAELWYASGESLVYVELNKSDGTVLRFVTSPLTGLPRGMNSLTMLQDGSLLGLRQSGNQSTFFHIPNPPRDGSPVTPVLLGIMPESIMIEALYTDCKNRLFAMDTGVDTGSQTGNRLLYISGNYLAGDFTYQVVTDFSKNTADIDDLGPGIDAEGNITDNPGFAIDTGTVYLFNYETATGKMVGRGGTWGIHALGGPLFDDSRSRLYLFSDQAELFLMDPATFTLSPALGKGPAVIGAQAPGHSGLAGPLTNCTTGFTIIL